MSRVIIAVVLGIGVVGLSALSIASPPRTAAASCVRIVAGNFDAAGDDNRNLNGEWVRIKNSCGTAQAIGGWKIHDEGNTYVFPAGFRIGAGKTVTLFTGRGTGTVAKRYWGYRSAVWNNTAPEWAYLRKADGSLVAKWTAF